MVLAELLISLAILGVIATFTIPKVLQAQESSTYNAIAKEAAATISAAYQSYIRDHGSALSTITPADLMPYMNYVKIMPNGYLIDDRQTYPSISVPCSSTGCVLLHNGAVVLFWAESFGGTGNLNAIFFLVDPDGKVTDGTTNGPGKSLDLALYYTGRITSDCCILPHTVDSNYDHEPNPAQDPPWFSWN